MLKSPAQTIKHQLQELQIRNCYTTLCSGRMTSAEEVVVSRIEPAPSTCFWSRGVSLAALVVPYGARRAWAVQFKI